MALYDIYLKESIEDLFWRIYLQSWIRKFPVESGSFVIANKGKTNIKRIAILLPNCINIASNCILTHLTCG